MRPRLGSSEVSLRAGRVMYRPRSAFWGLVPLALVAVTLVGSLAIPARQTWRITRLLGETTRVLTPARLLSAELQSGLGRELAALQSFALFGDSALLEQYKTTASNDERRLIALEGMISRLDTASATHAALLRSRIDRWRQLNAALIEQGGPHTRFAARLRAGQTQYDSSLGAMRELSSDLIADAAARDDRVRSLERLSIASNAALVLAALIAVAGVLVLTLRERRLTATLERRVAEESALRQLARELSATVAPDEALRCVADGAMAVTRASAAYVEWMNARDDVVDHVAIAGEDAPTPYAHAPYAGSLTEEISATLGSRLTMELAAIDGRLATRLGGNREWRAGLATPLLSSAETLGVLVLLRHATEPPFGEDERRQLRLVSDLASATLRRVEGMDAERRALEGARRHARQESALREAAEALAGAYTIDEVTRRIADTALAAVEAGGAFVEQIVPATAGQPAAVVVQAVAGVGVPPLDTTCPFAGSYTAMVTASGEPALIPNLEHLERSGTVGVVPGARGSAMVLPLGGALTPIGALFVVSSAPGHFRLEDVPRADTFGHLAALAYENVRLLDTAREGQRVLQRVIQSRSRLMRGFSHDVKNPIGAADGYAALLADGIYGNLSAEQHASVERMRRALHGALSLIDDLHELARAETGNITLSPTSVDLGKLAHDIVEDYDATARTNGLSLLLHVDPDVPLIQTDGTRVRQIASNLLSNAIKYTDHGSIAVRVSRQALGPSGEVGGWELLEFTDSGPGIPSGEQGRIFDEFSRLGDGTRPGAGLGLAISKLLAQALGGQIAVHSEIGNGSTFTLWLPHRDPGGPA